MKFQLLGNIGFVRNDFKEGQPIAYGIVINDKNQVVVIIGELGHAIQQLPEDVNEDLKIWLMYKINSFVDSDQLIDVNKLVNQWLGRQERKEERKAAAKQSEENQQ